MVQSFAISGVILVTKATVYLGKDSQTAKTANSATKNSSDKFGNPVVFLNTPDDSAEEPLQRFVNFAHGNEQRTIRTIDSKIQHTS